MLFFQINRNFSIPKFLYRFTNPCAFKDVREKAIAAKGLLGYDRLGTIKPTQEVQYGV